MLRHGVAWPLPLLLLAFIGDSAEAQAVLRWEMLARPTTAADDLHPGQPPTPTRAPMLGRAADVHRRQDGSIGPATCGFYDDPMEGDNAPFVCANTAQTCTNSGSFRGCCRGAGCTRSSAFSETCSDATAGACNTGTLCCSSAAPYCVTHLWSTSASPEDVFTFYGCGANDRSRTIHLSAEPRATTTVRTSAAVVPTTTSAPTSADGGATETVAAVANSSGTADSPAPAPAPGPPWGAIAGGVVGGLAVLALLGFAVFFVWWRSRKTVAQHGSRNGTTPDGYTGGGGGVPQMAAQQQYYVAQHAATTQSTVKMPMFGEDESVENLRVGRAMSGPVVTTTAAADVMSERASVVPMSMMASPEVIAGTPGFAPMAKPQLTLQRASLVPSQQPGVLHPGPYEISPASLQVPSPVGVRTGRTPDASPTVSPEEFSRYESTWESLPGSTLTQTDALGLSVPATARPSYEEEPPPVSPISTYATPYVEKPESAHVLPVSRP